MFATSFYPAATAAMAAADPRLQAFLWACLTFYAGYRLGRGAQAP